MIDNRDVGRRIARLRQERGLTQMQLAAMMNVSHQAVSKWESGAAMPDIQTLLELTRFFGLTVEQMTGADIQEEPLATEEVDDNCACDETAGTEESPAPETPEAGEANDEKEVKCNMNVKQLLQMAPYMTKEAVMSVALSMEGPLTADDIARLAPFLPQEGLEALVAKHRPQFSWETLRRLAPFMRRETVDTLVRSIASGEQTVSAPSDDFDRRMDDLGRAFDGLGRGVDKAVRHALRLGDRIVTEVGSALGGLARDAKEEVKEEVEVTLNEEKPREDRSKELRRRAFERALADGRWVWLGAHIDELDDGDELKSRIAQRARELGMTGWLEENMEDYVDASVAEAAIQDGDFEWLEAHIDALNRDQQLRAAHMAAAQEQWGWLEECIDEIDFGSDIDALVREIWHGGNVELAVRFAEENFSEAGQHDALFREGVDAGDRALTDSLWESISAECARAELLRLAKEEDWAQVKARLEHADRETLELLMEHAVDQGNFEAVDFLNDEL